MTKEKCFVVDPPSFSLSLPLYPSPSVTSTKQFFLERHALCMHMFEIWKNLGTCISVYAVYPKPLLNHQTLILPITFVSVISNSTSGFWWSTEIPLRSPKYSLVTARIGEIEIKCNKPDLYTIKKNLLTLKQNIKCQNYSFATSLVFICTSHKIW